MPTETDNISPDLLWEIVRKSPPQPQQCTITDIKSKQKQVTDMRW
jgi:hypothetical protein